MRKILTAICLSMAGVAAADEFQSNWKNAPDRLWTGKHYWANRLQDWEVKNGKASCRTADFKWNSRTLQLISGRISNNASELELSVNVAAVDVSDKKLYSGALGGVLLGCGEELDVWGASLAHESFAPGSGLACGINGRGHLVIRDLENGGKTLAEGKQQFDINISNGIGVKITQKSPLWQIKVTSGTESIVTDVSWDKLSGNVALVSHPGIINEKDGKKLSGISPVRFAFSDWKVKGDAFRLNGQDLGPIVSSQYTLSRGTMKMTAQLMPVTTRENVENVELQVKKNGKWTTIDKAPVIVPGYSATFRVIGWNDSQDTAYRLIYRDKMRDGSDKIGIWEGTIRKDPKDKKDIVVAAFTGNHNMTRWSCRDWNLDGVAYPHKDLYDRVVQHKPDLLFWSGDQVYEWDSPTHADKSGTENSYYDYLYKWYLFCISSREMTKDIPSVCITDDHDVFQGNIWGAGGKKAPYQEYGGYELPVEWIRMVERTQTSHLPDPFDPREVAQGIGVYYTDMVYGRISFAILEDRKFKSGPRGTVIPLDQIARADHIVDPKIDLRSYDKPGLKLLGDRQLKFLNHWSKDWKGADQKCVLTQSVFANMATHHGKEALNRGGFLVADLDSNGWPQTGRRKALEEIRRGYAFTVGGDQHLGSMIQHGIDNWNDCGWALTVPSIANYYPRGWYPTHKGNKHIAGMPDYTGEYLESFKNKVTVWAVNNPDKRSGKEPASIHDRMPGYGIIKFHKPTAKITMECWPRWANPAKPEQQYTGWPKTVTVDEQYGRKAVTYLPELKIKGLKNPVVQIINEKTDQVVYTRRIKGNSFCPKVFAKGSYTIKVGNPDTNKWKTFKGIRSSLDTTLKVNF